jgi:hypothetical protein
MSTETITVMVDEENVWTIPLEFSESLEKVLEGRARYHLARFAAVAKGAKDRQLEPDQIYFPTTAMVISEGKARISSLKATFPIPDGVKVKGVVFFKKAGPNGPCWSGHLQVCDAAA